MDHNASKNTSSGDKNILCLWDISPFHVGPLLLMFGTSDNVCSGFRSKVNPLPYVLHRLHAMGSSDAGECDTDLPLGAITVY